MQTDKENRLDNMLRGNLDGKPSRLPADMLDRILEKNRRKKRLMWWWLHFAVGAYCLGLVLYLTGMAWNNTRIFPDKPAVTPLPAESGIRPYPHGEEVPSPDRMEPNTDPANESVTVNSGQQNSQSERSHSIAKNDHDLTESSVSEMNKNDAQIPRKTAWDSQTDNMENAVEPISEPLQTVNDAPLPPPAPPMETTISTLADSVPNKTAEPPAKSENKSKFKTMLHALQWDAVASVGWMNEQQKLGVTNDDPRYVHKDMASVLGSAARPANGFQINLGVSTALPNHFSFQGGIQYVNLHNHLHVDYLIDKVPVIDMDGTIKGYIEVQDTFKQRVVVNKEFGTSIISMPVQVGYSFSLGTKNELMAGIGIRPQIHLVGEWVVPENINITSLHWTAAKELFSAPASINFGYYRKEGKYTFGISAKWNPLYTSPKDLGEHVNLRSRQNEIGFLLMYRLTPKP